MDKRALFEKIYNGEITEDDVIVELVKDDEEEYENYILNDKFDYWDETGIKSLSFFINTNTENYKETYSIISKEEYEIKIDKIRKQKEIKILEEKLRRLKEED